MAIPLGLCVQLFARITDRVGDLSFTEMGVSYVYEIIFKKMKYYSLNIKILKKFF